MKGRGKEAILSLVGLVVNKRGKPLFNGNKSNRLRWMLGFSPIRVANSCGFFQAEICEVLLFVNPQFMLGF